SSVGNSVFGPYSFASTWSMVVPHSRSNPSVRLGLRTPDRYIGAGSEWPPERTPPLLRPLTITTLSRNGSNGFRMGEKSKSTPAVLGVNRSMMIPFGTYAAANRRTGIAATVRDCAVAAGIIASSNGNATAAPRPFKKVLRGNDMRVMNIDLISYGCPLAHGS